MPDNKQRKFPLSLPFPIPFLRRRLNRSPKSNFAAASVALSENVLGSAVSYATAGSATSIGVATPAAPPPPKIPLKPASDVFAGALARAASQSTIHPLDTLKVQLQTKKRGVSVGNIGGPGIAFAWNLPNLGKQVGALYRGVVGAAGGAGIAIGAYFAFYGAACNIISRNTDLPPGAVAFLSGGVAAVGSSFVKVPLAVCIRSVQAGVYPNFFTAAKSIVAATGPRGLFTGYLPTVMEDVPDMAMKFAAYETMRTVHKKWKKGQSPAPQEDFVMGAIAGALAAAATTPLDVIKTNMMCSAASRPTLFTASAAIYAEGGTAAFFRGMGPRALSNGINSATFFCFFEAIRGAIQHQKQQKQQQALAA